MCYCVVAGPMEESDVTAAAALEEIGLTLAVRNGASISDTLDGEPRDTPTSIPTLSGLLLDDKTTICSARRTKKQR